MSNALRNQHRDELKRLLEAKLAAFDDCEALADRLMNAGVPCAPIRDEPAALADPHTAHRGTVVEIGDYKGVASPIKLSRTLATYRVGPLVRVSLRIAWRVARSISWQSFTDAATPVAKAVTYS